MSSGTVGASAVVRRANSAQKSSVSRRAVPATSEAPTPATPPETSATAVQWSRVDGREILQHHGGADVDRRPHRLSPHPQAGALRALPCRSVRRRAPATGRRGPAPGGSETGSGGDGPSRSSARGGGTPPPRAGRPAGTTRRDVPRRCRLSPEIELHARSARFVHSRRARSLPAGAGWFPSAAFRTGCPAIQAPGFSYAIVILKPS